MQQVVGVKPKGKPRGLATMSLEKRREIARLGGKAAHACGHAHRWTPEEASQAGKRAAAVRWGQQSESEREA